MYHLLQCNWTFFHIGLETVDNLLATSGHQGKIRIPQQVGE